MTSEARIIAGLDAGIIERDDRDRLRDERAELGCSVCAAPYCEQGVVVSLDEFGHHNERWCSVCDGTGFRAPLSLRLVELDLNTLEPLSGEEVDDAPF